MPTSRRPRSGGYAYPAVTVVLEFGDGPLMVADDTGREQRGSLVAGLAPGAVHVRGRGIECIQVRLSPVVSHAVLSASGMSPAELDGTVVALEDLWGRLLRVDELAAKVGWSYKRLWSRFRSQIGRTPKHAARLVRFDHAAHLLAAGQDAARVAAECGYADQSHLHRDVRAFAGATPAAVAVAPWLAVDGVAWAARRGDRVDSAAAELRVVDRERTDTFSKCPSSIPIRGLPGPKL